MNLKENRAVVLTLLLSFLIGIILLLSIFMLSCSFKSELNNENRKDLNKIFNKPSKPISRKYCQFQLSVSGMGGFLILSLGEVDKIPKLKVDDVTGVGWLTDSILIYSVSPIYGRPGIDRYDCNVHQITQLVQAENKNDSYPSGSDYFELKELSEVNKEVSFYYAPDVDKVDFNLFRQKKNIRKIKVKK